MRGWPAERVRRWAGRGGLAVLDQGLFSGANFLVNILLARWLAPEEYGAFAVALSIFYLLTGFHTAVLTEPMMIFGAGKYRDHFRRYVGLLLQGHWAISLVFSLALAIAAWVAATLGSGALGQALAGLALATPFLLLFWLARRGCHVGAGARWAVLGSGINLVTAAAGMLGLWQAGLLSPLSGLVLLGAAGGLASFALLIRRRPPVRGGAADGPTHAGVLADHRGYAKWNLLGVLGHWASGQVLMLLIPVFLGLSASAAVAAVWNLYRPIGLLTQSLGLVLLPVFTRWAHRGMGAPELRRRALVLGACFGGAVLVYGGLLTLSADRLLDFLYAGKYGDLMALVGIMAGATAASSVVGVQVLSLKASGRIRCVPHVWTVSAAAGVFLSIPLMIGFGVEGAMAGVLLGRLIAGFRGWRLAGAVAER